MYNETETKLYSKYLHSLAIEEVSAITFNDSAGTAIECDYFEVAYSQGVYAAVVAGSTQFSGAPNGLHIVPSGAYTGSTDLSATVGDQGAGAPGYVAQAGTPLSANLHQSVGAVTLRNQTGVALTNVTISYGKLRKVLWHRKVGNQQVGD